MMEHVFRRRLSLLIGAFAALITLFVVFPARADSSTTFKRPVFFEHNDGQSDPSVLYLMHGLGYSLFLTHSGATIVLPTPMGNGSHRLPSGAQNFFSLSFVGSNPNARVTGVDPLPGHSNYFSSSDPKLWHTGIAQFAKVKYAGLYHGIDVLFYVRDGQLEYDILAAPGANLHAVRIKETGARPHLTSSGDIALGVGRKQFILKEPRVYQPDDPQSRLIPTRYGLRGNDLFFHVGRYDRTRPLTIDPALIFSTYLSSNCKSVFPDGTSDPCTDTVADIAADASGIYVTGSTSGNSFPATNSMSQIVASMELQTFVFKLDPTGSNLLYANYLSSSAGLSVAVDVSGAAYLTGTASIPPATGSASFPLTSGVFSGTVPANPVSSFQVPYAVKLSADGSQILYSTLLQQPTPNATTVSNPQKVTPTKIAVDAQGALYVAGTVGSDPNNTRSSWEPLPTTQGAFQTTPGTLFALKLTPNASGMTYATYFDGTEGTNGAVGSGRAVTGIAVDSNGDVFLGGTATGDFPTTPGAYLSSSPASAGTTNAFVMQLNPSGTSPVYSTFFGVSGSLPTTSYGLAVDPQGEAVIVGYSFGTLPVTPDAFCGVASNTSNSISGYIAKFNAGGTGLVYATTLCGDDAEADAVAVDSTGAAYVLGETDYPDTFPLMDEIQSYFTPSELSEVVLKVDTNGALLWSSLLGQSAIEFCSACRIQVDPSGAAYLLSSGDSFPTTPNTVGLRGVGISRNNGPGLLIKIAPSLGKPVPLATPTSVTFPAQNVATSSASLEVQVGNFGDAPMSPIVTITGDFSETDDCSVGVAGGQKCDVNIVFTPTATGPRTGVMTLSFGGSIAPETVALSGSGSAPAANIAPTSLSFGDQMTGTTSGAQQVTVTNIGTGPLLVSSVQTSTEFAATNTCGASIAPASNCTIQVTFTPTASGVQTGTLEVNDNASGSPQIVLLSGNQPATFALTSSAGSSNSVTVAPGQTATYALNIIGSDGFAGAVSFMCSGIPAGTNCSISPNPVSVSGTSAVPVTVSIVTNSASSLPSAPSNSHNNSTSGRYSLVIGFGLLLLAVFLSLTSGNKDLRKTYLGFALLSLFVICAGCGGASSSSTASTNSTAPTTSATPKGSYSITVTGTSGSLTQSMIVTLNVN